jgi:hypothetical protein
MVSKTLASLDAWLALAEEVLKEQDALQREQRARDELDRKDLPARVVTVPRSR